MGGGVLVKNRKTFDTYQKPENLEEGKIEYIDASMVQTKEQTLNKAANLAESGDYISAISLLKNVREPYREDADYRSVYSAYCEEHKNKTIIAADNLAASTDYISAIKK